MKKAVELLFAMLFHSVFFNSKLYSVGLPTELLFRFLLRTVCLLALMYFVLGVYYSIDMPQQLFKGIQK